MKITFKYLRGLLVPYSEKDQQNLNKLEDGVIYQVEVKKFDDRTIQQNKLIHQFCLNISNEAKKQNMKLDKLIKHDTPLSMLAVKELIFKSVVMSLYGKDSTTKLKKDELNLVFDTIIRALGTKGLDTKNLLREKD